MKPSPHQTRVTTAGHEMLIPVDGLLTWRPASWEVSPLSTNGSLDDAQLRPLVASYERLMETMDGRLSIHTVWPRLPRHIRTSPEDSQHDDYFP